ncbi:hypothetical protein SOV_50970 [Sporomusa ovata DSM 2662]|uniref:Uncharacterized protein n=1 Tax=Sporomusa ovata TaxID=2378 RepID=A0A0U1L319_9FIRM|nr:hypothetical protein [Sporomusa ovata]EQB27470.1 hypothetical protein SOV_2c03660 [Sporomusa ovata DSM 2662]CQR73314.1 hypothetical protein SpAn4DRAFT_2546 [Sporomusa ovata]
MRDIAYKCLNEKCNAIFHGIDLEGICCPLCGDCVVPVGEFEDYFIKDIPSYKSLKKTQLSGNQMVSEKSIEEFRESGMLWLINNLLHIFGWAVVVETDGDKVVRMYPARVKFRGFSEKSNTDGYISVSRYMNDNAEELLKEANE